MAWFFLSQRYRVDRSGEVPNISQQGEKSLWSQNKFIIGKAVKRECWYSIWNFTSSENETIKTLYNYRLQQQFTESAMPLNVYLAEKAWQCLCLHILLQCRPGIFSLHPSFVCHYFTISPDQFLNFLYLKHQCLQTKGAWLMGKGAYLYIVSSGKHSSIPPCGSILLLINYLYVALGRKALSSRAPNKQ